MSQTHKFLFDNPATITHDSALVRFDSGVASLRDLAADGMFYADYASTIDATWSGGTGTGTANGGAAVAGGQLVLTGATSKSVDYDADKNADFQQKGTVRMTVTPGYNGSPAATRTFFAISSAAAAVLNLLRIHHNAAGNIILDVNDSAGASIMSANLGAFVAVSGTPFELEVDLDITTGATRVFIDGTQQGATQVATGTRSSAIGLFRIGQDESAATNPDFSVENPVVFAVVKHTADYTVGAAAEEIPATQPGYATSDPKLVLPGSFQADDLIAFSSTVTKPGSDEIKFILLVDNIRKYFNGSIWLDSDGSYSQANTGSEINDNLESLSVASEIELETFLHSDAGDTTPDITSVTIEFELELGEPSAPNDCLVYGWIRDHKGTPLPSILINVSTAGFLHGSHTIAATRRQIISDSDGYWEVLLAETETINLFPYNFSFLPDVSGGDGASLSTFFRVQIPDEESIEFSEIVRRNNHENPGGEPDDDDKTAAVLDIVIEQGSNYEATFTVTDSGGAPVDLTSVTAVEMQFRPAANSSQTVLSISMAGGEITIPTPLNGEVIVSVGHAVTAEIFQGGFYDMEFTDFPSAGKKKRMVEGQYRVTHEVTR